MKLHRVLMGLTLMGALCLPSAHAGNIHYGDETHLITFVLKDTNGSYVSGDTVRVTIRSSDNVNYYDWNDNTWGTFASATTPHQTMNEDSDGNFYFITFTSDATVITTGDIAVIISVDTASVKTLEVRSVNYSNIGDLVRVHR